MRLERQVAILLPHPYHKMVNTLSQNPGYVGHFVTSDIQLAITTARAEIAE